MGKGVDVDARLTVEQAHCLKDGGYTFVARYYGLTKAEPLTRDEALMLSSVGLWIVAIWESGFPTDPSYFDFSRGLEDGKAAYSYACDTILQPAGSTIYFAVDYDSPVTDRNVIMAYFHGVREAFANGTNNPSQRYYTGVYGSGYVCAYLLGAGYVHRTWMAYAPGWARSGWQGAELVQTGEASVCGLPADEDVSNGDAGGFQVKGE